MRNVFRLILSACLLVGVLSFGMQASASETTHEEGYINAVQLNESMLELELENAEGYIEEDGTAFIKDDVTGTVVDLPKQTLDKNDEKVNLVYKQDGKNLIVELHEINNNTVQTMGFWKCTLGTAGAAGAGAMTGMTVGAVAASPFTVLGGGVFGGAFGGMTGAAASCFK
ncbi:hypothetical protein [Priestia megaterium]|uniref:hypothetical protein n=1 Tax=Priestia megaterium TaxID=1404 RepID=UPI003009DB16